MEDPRAATLPCSMKSGHLPWVGKSRIVDATPQGARAPEMPAFLGKHPVTAQDSEALGMRETGSEEAAHWPRSRAGKPDTDHARRSAPPPRALQPRGMASPTSPQPTATTSTIPMPPAGLASWRRRASSRRPSRAITSAATGSSPRACKGKGRRRSRPAFRITGSLQPVVLVSDDGRSATGRFRLFQPRTGKTVGKAGDFFAAQFWGGMYHDRYVLEERRLAHLGAHARRALHHARRLEGWRVGEIERSRAGHTPAAVATA